MTRALPFPKPMGVIESEAKREAQIIAEFREGETRIIHEHARGRYVLRFMDPYKSLVEYLELVRGLEAKGYEFGPGQWMRDKAGIINGIEFTEETACL